MTIINRASLPEEFFDVTSGSMLKQPEPQYLFALFMKLSLGSAMSLALGSMGITPDRAIADKGAAPTQPGADRLMLANADPQSAQVIMTVPELGKSPGHTVRINRPRYGSGGFTLALREIASGATISTTAIDLGSEQVTVTLKRYGGPYDTGQTAVAPYALDKFDASVSLHSLAQYVGLHMQRDYDKWLDNITSVLMSTGSTTLYPQGFSADNNSQAVGDMPMDIDMLFRGYETLKNGNIPMFPNGRYRACISPTAARQLKGDPQAAQYIRYDTAGMNPLMGSAGAYVGQISGVDIFEATTLQATNNAQSIPVTNNIMFGPGMVGAGYGQLPTVKYSTDDNYGEHAKVLWLAYAGFTVADIRFGVQMHTT